MSLLNRTEGREKKSIKNRTRRKRTRLEREEDAHPRPRQGGVVQVQYGTGIYSNIVFS
jgi:hypothetical protein